MGARDDVNSTLGAAFPGLVRGQVRLVPYDPAWPAAYEREAARLQRKLGDRVLAIAHIGSTAVPGLIAKPLLDIMVAIPALADVAELEPQLVALGYVFHPRDTIPDRHFFIAGDGDLRRVNLSLVEPDSAYWRNHLAFRDALRTQPETAANYARLKKELAAIFQDNRLAYTEAKGAFVARVLAACARAERDPGHR
jgi:GrpB-like predicted nucleotidyltransferase (UPF0157 family)